VKAYGFFKGKGFLENPVFENMHLLKKMVSERPWPLETCGL
jgi:hypothetical protein